MGESSHSRKIWICRLQKEEIKTRKFQCTKCNYIHIFQPKGSQKFPKRVKGFFCPRCGHRPTEAEIARIKGRGPKPKGERRMRVNNEVIKNTPKSIVHPYVEQFEWRTNSPLPPGEPQRYGGRAEWQPKSHQPTTRTLEDAVVEAFLSSPKRGQKK